LENEFREYPRKGESDSSLGKGGKIFTRRGTSLFFLKTLRQGRGGRDNYFLPALRGGGVRGHEINHLHSERKRGNPSNKVIFNLRLRRRQVMVYFLWRRKSIHYRALP